VSRLFFVRRSQRRSTHHPTLMTVPRSNSTGVFVTTLPPRRGACHQHSALGEKHFKGQLILRAETWPTASPAPQIQPHSPRRPQTGPGKYYYPAPGTRSVQVSRRSRAPATMRNASPTRKGTPLRRRPSGGRLATPSRLTTPGGRLHRVSRPTGTKPPHPGPRVRRSTPAAPRNPSYRSELLKIVNDASPSSSQNRRLGA